MLACEKVTQDDRMIDLHSIFVTVEQEKFLEDASRAISLAKRTFKLHNDHYQGQLLQNSRALKAFISQIEGFAGIEELRRVSINATDLEKMQNFLTATNRAGPGRPMTPKYSFLYH